MENTQIILTIKDLWMVFGGLVTLVVTAYALIVKLHLANLKTYCRERNESLWLVLNEIRLIMKESEVRNNQTAKDVAVALDRTGGKNE